jgi:hypothetical protein
MPTNYDLLKEIHSAVERLEAKVDDRFSVYDGRLNKVESKLDNLLGKAALGLVVFMSIFGTAVTLFVEWVKGRLR